MFIIILRHGSVLTLSEVEGSKIFTSIFFYSIMRRLSVPDSYASFASAYNRQNW